MKISIITPCYHGGRYLPALLEMINENAWSIIDEFPDARLEYIIVNDCPEDVIEIPAHDPIFEHRLITYEQNRGIHGARTAGICAASGDYIFMLDQDDEISQDCLHKHLHAIGNADFTISNAWMEQSDGSKRLLYRNTYQFQKALDLRKYAISHNQIASPGQCLIRRSAIPEEWLHYEIQKNGSDDLLLWIIMLSRNASAVLVKDAIYTHNYTGSNLSENQSNMITSSLEAFDYLATLPGIDPKIIRQCKRSRSFVENWKHSSGIGKLGLGAEHADILVKKAVWKIRGMIGR